MSAYLIYLFCLYNERIIQPTSLWNPYHELGELQVLCTEMNKVLFLEELKE